MKAFWNAFLLVFFAEMGDKTQIISFTFGANYPLHIVLLGVFLAIASLMACCVGIGTLAGAYLPAFWINIASGLLFIGFGAWTLKGDDDGAEESAEADADKGKKRHLGPLLAVMVTFFLAELGDKTVFAGIAIGSKEHNYPMVWLGSTLGMFASDLIAILCGRVLGKQLPEKLVKYGSAVILILAGLYTLADTIAPVYGWSLKFW